MTSYKIHILVEFVLVKAVLVGDPLYLFMIFFYLYDLERHDFVTYSDMAEQFFIRHLQKENKPKR